MSSALAAQLQLVQQLQQRAPSNLKKFKGKPSLLFDFQKAADVDVESIYEIALQGYAELCRVNPKFTTLREALFSRAAASIVRDQQSQDVLAKLDAAIDEFCALLTGHFLSPAAFKALEYLIRRFRANEFNIHSLMMAGIPYHATNEFVLLVQTMPLEPARGLWGWLTPGQKSGASLPRQVLVQRCMTDPQLLTWLCETAKKLGSGPLTSKAYQSFYAVTLCEFVTEMKVMSETQLAALVPWISCGLESSASPEYQAATLMIVASLTSKVTLGKDMVKALVSSILRNHKPHPELSRTVLMVMTHIAATQPLLTRIPDKAVRALFGLPDLVKELATLQQARIKLAPLVKLFGNALLKHMTSDSPDQSADILVDLVNQKLVGDMATPLATQLIEQACQESCTASQQAAAKNVLRALDLHYPTETDAAVNALLAASSHATANDETITDASAAVDSNGKKTKKNEKKQQQQSEQRSAVFEFVQALFDSSARAPCDKDSGLTLAAAVSAPAAGVRRMALAKMCDILVKQGVSVEAQSSMMNTVLNGFQDDDMNVVTGLLEHPAMHTLPAALLVPALSTAAIRCSALVFGNSSDADNKASLKAACEAYIKIMSVLVDLHDKASVEGSDAVQQETQDLLVLLIMEAALPAVGSTQVTIAALTAAEKVDHPLFKLMREVLQLVSTIQGASKADSKTSRKADKQGGVKSKGDAGEALKKLPAAVVEAIAKALCVEPSKFFPEMDRLVGIAHTVAHGVDSTAGANNKVFLRARHLMLLAMHTSMLHALKASTKSKEAATVLHQLAVQVLQHTLAQLALTGSSGNASWKDTVSKCLDDLGRPNDAHAKEISRNAATLHNSVLCQVLLASLECMPAASTNTANVSGTVQDLTKVFVQVASLQPHGSYDSHLHLVVSKALPEMSDYQAFLATLYCKPVSEEAKNASSAEVQLAALRLVAQSVKDVGHTAHAATPIKGKATNSLPTSAESVQAIAAHIPHMLCALRSSHPEVRAAALQTSTAVGTACSAQTGSALAMLGAFINALNAHKKWLLTDSNAFNSLLTNTLSASSTSASDALMSTPTKPSKKGRATQGQATAEGAQPVATSNASATLSIPPAVMSVVVKMLAELLPRYSQHQHDLAAASTLLVPVSSAVARSGVSKADWLAAVVTASLNLLHAIIHSTTAAGSSCDMTSGQQSVAALAAQIVFSCQAWPEGYTSDKRVDIAMLLLQVLASSPSALDGTSYHVATSSTSWYSSSGAVRLAALQCTAVGQAPQLVLHALGNAAGKAADNTATYSQALVQVLAAGAASDADVACREAARVVLSAMPVTVQQVVPVLQAAVHAVPSTAAASAPGNATEPATPSKRRKKKDADLATQVAAADAATPAPSSGALERAILLLEMLQWKAVTEGGEEHIVNASQSLLATLQPTMSSIAQSHGQDDNEDDGAETAGKQADVSSRLSSLAGYAAQLILTSLEAVSSRVQAALPEAGRKPGSIQKVQDAFDMQLVVSVAQAAPDALVRNAALALLARLATLNPQVALKHVLEVLAIVSTATAASDDAYSQQVATTALTSLVPTWINHKQDLGQLWEAVVSALPTLPSHRRMPVLSTMLKAAEAEPTALPAGLLVMLQDVVAAQEKVVAAKKAGSGNTNKEQQATGVDDKEWLLNLASQLALQVPLSDRIVALASLLQRSIKASQSQAHTPLAKLAVNFTCAQLKDRSIVGSGLSLQHDDALLPSCEVLMQQALAVIQILATATTGADDSSAARDRAVRSSIHGVYALFEALQAVMAPHSYLKALIQLCRQSDDKVQRRALRLFADRAAILPADLERIAAHPAYNKSTRHAANQRLASASLSILGVLTTLSARAAGQPVDGDAPATQDGNAANAAGKGKKKGGAKKGEAGNAAPPSALTMQAAIASLSNVAAAFGAAHAEEFKKALPHVLAQLDHPNSAVRGSALAAVASIVRACGSQVLALLPTAAKAVTTACEAASALLTTQQQSSIPTATASQKATAKRGKVTEPDEDADDTTDDASSVGQQASVELAAGLTALNSLVVHMGPFLSPYLPSMLRVLLLPSVLTCAASNCKDIAAAVRKGMPKTIPARLLLDPLFNSLQFAVEQGLESYQALMQAVNDVVDGLEPSAASASCDTYLAFLLKALDVRNTTSPALAGAEYLAESAAAKTLVTLTLKLSEVKFKPMFLRLVEWAMLPTSSGTPNVGRLTALFTTASLLSESLRSVFVPYFRNLLDLAVKHLSDKASTAAAGKKRKKSMDASLAGAAFALTPAQQAAHWVLRGKILRALHRCFLYDSVAWTDQDKVDLILPSLVAQLETEPPAAAAAAVAQQCADPELDAAVNASLTVPFKGVAASRHSTDTYGRATVGVIVSLAAAANSDVAWKPLNRQVLMTTRSGPPHTRVLAMEIVAILVERLREEYLVLLPETLPFLAELLEDPERDVEARAKAVLRALENVSGEKLDQYLKTN